VPRPTQSTEERNDQSSLLDRRRRGLVEPALQPACAQPGQPLPLVPGDQRGQLERLAEVDVAALSGDERDLGDAEVAALDWHFPA
jgi:hypothetical protein